MPIVTGPLHSARASGALGRELIYYRWRGFQCVRRWAAPSQPNTPAQVSSRFAFAAATNAWGLLQPDEARIWRMVANRTLPPGGGPRGGWSGQNAFVAANVWHIRLWGDVELEPVPRWVSIPQGAVQALQVPGPRLRLSWGPLLPQPAGAGVLIYGQGPLASAARRVRACDVRQWGVVDVASGQWDSAVLPVGARYHLGLRLARRGWYPGPVTWLTFVVT